MLFIVYWQHKTKPQFYGVDFPPMPQREALGKVMNAKFHNSVCDVWMEPDVTASILRLWAKEKESKHNHKDWK